MASRLLAIIFVPYLRKKREKNRWPSRWVQALGVTTPLILHNFVLSLNKKTYLKIQTHKQLSKPKQRFLAREVNFSETDGALFFFFVCVCSFCLHVTSNSQWEFDVGGTRCVHKSWTLLSIQGKWNQSLSPPAVRTQTGFRNILLVNAFSAQWRSARWTHGGRVSVVTEDVTLSFPPNRLKFR